MFAIAGFAAQEEVDHITIWKGLVLEKSARRGEGREGGDLCAAGCWVGHDHTRSPVPPHLAVVPAEDANLLPF